MWTFTLVRVGSREGAEFAFSSWSLCIYYPFVPAKLFCISNVRKAPKKPLSEPPQNTPPSATVSLANPLTPEAAGVKRFCRADEQSVIVLTVFRANPLSN